MPRIAVLTLVALLVAACAGSADDAGPTTTTAAPPAPEVSAGAPDDDVAVAIDDLLASIEASDGALVDLDALDRLGATGDARLGWFVADLMRFFQGGNDGEALRATFERLTGAALLDPVAWGAATDLLIEWDLPDFDGYVEAKGRLFRFVEPGWAPFFDDPDATIDWRHVSWGGVLIDDRPLDAVDRPCERGCIPALDDPAVTDAAGGGWYADDGIVFGVVVDGEARAYPRHIMEIHEMVNDELGGRRLGIPYCTLCASAQAYLTDDPVAAAAADRYELRTSGLLVRSNKVMWEFHTRSLVDTFTGEARSGPLLDAGVVLDQVPVLTTTWGEWKAEYPDTTIVAEDGGIGRDYPLDPLGGRDDNGPIFPIGDTDPRLAVQDQIVGVVTDDGAFAFSVVALETSGLDAVEAGGVRAVADAGGWRIESLNGEPLASHQAFWFAWSQFHDDTGLWTG